MRHAAAIDAATAVHQAEVSYKWLRGTKDDGGYLGPSRLLMNKRKMRSVMVSLCALHAAGHAHTAAVLDLPQHVTFLPSVSST